MLFRSFDDADIDNAVKGAMVSKYRNAGQTCVCVNRILVQDSVYDAFVSRFSAAVGALRVGDGFEAGVTIGPLINMVAVNKVEEHISDGVSKGARIIVGGKRHAMGRSFYEPTVLADATPDMLIFREETFGPVAPVFRFKTEEEAVRLAILVMTRRIRRPDGSRSKITYRQLHDRVCRFANVLKSDGVAKGDNRQIPEGRDLVVHLQKAHLQVSNLSKSFGGAKALDDVSFDVQKGEVICIIGPSGCGKNTLLRSINYLTELDEGA